jgi:uncharacterized RDD family membrane protein YckC
MREDDFLTRGVLVRRIAAFVLDGILVLLLLGVLKMLLFAFGLLTLGLGFPLFGLLPLVPALYNWLSLLSPLSATPGQAMMGVTVRRNDDLSPPGGLQALVWVIGWLLTIAAGLIWLALALVTVRHRTLHDLVSGLVVVRSRALTPPPGSWNMAPGGFSAR